MHSSNLSLDLFPDTAQVNEAGHLTLAGLDVVTLAGEFGTPLYIYDAATLRARCQAYHTALDKYYPASAYTAYASKAYLNTAIARLMVEAKMHLDVVSGGELYVALRAGFPAAHIHVHGNNKSPDELTDALYVGVGRIVVDNFDELERLIDLTAQHHLPVKVWLRLAPNVEAHTHAYRKTGLLDSKFGFSIATGDAERAVQKICTTPDLELWGLHAHVGSQILETQPFVQAVDALLEFYAQMRDVFALRELSPGGGLGVAYTESDTVPSIASYVQAVSDAVVAGCQARDIPLPTLVLEPGRSIVGPAGIAVYTVGGRKEIPDTRIYVSVDGGMADNVRPALYGACYTAYLVNRMTDLLDETVTIAGRYCESGDVLVRDVALPRAHLGDVVGIPVSGAYNLALSNNYNLARRPAVLLVREGQAHLIQRRETYEDMTQRDIDL